MSKPKLYFNWSTGKDASMALHALQQKGYFEIDQLVTSINAHHNRVSMHGLRRTLMEQQAAAVGITLTTIELPEEPDMPTYEAIMTKVVKSLQVQGYKNSAFGDIFLEDLRAYREKQLEAYDMQCHFPLWKKDTTTLIHDFLRQGFKAVIISSRADLLDESFSGRDIDENFLADLPENVDPCGENGEFHTFCYDGPIFKNPVPFSIGEKVYREYDNPKDAAAKIGFWFCDLVPK